MNSKGWVKFPYGDKNYRTGENGMAVAVVVKYFGAPSYWDEGFATVPVVQTYGDCFQGDHKRSASDGADLEYYPHTTIVGVEDDAYIGNEGVDLLACVVLGTSDRAFWNVAAEEYWRAQFTDLTPEGAALVEMLKQLYPGYEVTLLTWLDT